jgi:hypothetical protein
MDHPHITVEINPISHPIPNCLLQNDVISENLTPVALPQRFLRASNPGEDEEDRDCPGAREKDLASALLWLKQQMVRVFYNEHTGVV